MNNRKVINKKNMSKIMIASLWLLVGVLLFTGFTLANTFISNTGTSTFSSNLSTDSNLFVNGNINVANTSAYLYDGQQALKLTKGADTYYTNTFVGAGAGNSSAVKQTAVGWYAGYANTGDKQTALGFQAGRSNTGIYQTTVGVSAGGLNTGNYQTAIGMYAGYSNTGASQTTLGDYAGQSNTGSAQTAIGLNAGQSNSGTHQTAIGNYAGRLNTGDSQTTIGYSAGQSNKGKNVIGLGSYATYNNSGNDVVAIGYQAGKDNTVKNQFIVKQASVNSVPLIQGDFSTGNVGIGTTTPTSKLDVNGSINAKNITADNINNVYYVTKLTSKGIRDAYNSCDGIHTCIIQLLPKVYNITSHITVKNNTILRGYGEATILNVTVGGIATAWRINGYTQNVTFKDFVFANNNFDTGYIFDFRLGMDNLIMNNIHIKDSSSSAITVFGTNNLFENNWLENVNSGIGINVVGAKDLSYTVYDETRIINNRIENMLYNSSSTTEYGEGIEINSHKVNNSVAIIYGNIIKGFREEGIDCNSQNCIITNNKIEMNLKETSRETHAITIGHSINSSTNNREATGTISNNIITNVPPVSTGEAIRIDSNTFGFSINNNIISGTENMLGTGIRISDGADKISVINNEFYNLNIGFRTSASEGEKTMLLGNSFQNVTTKIMVDHTTGDLYEYNFENVDFNNLEVNGGNFRLKSSGSTKEIMIINQTTNSPALVINQIGSTTINNPALKLNAENDSSLITFNNINGPGNLYIKGIGNGREYLFGGAYSSGNYLLTFDNPSSGRFDVAINDRLNVKGRLYVTGNVSSNLIPQTNDTYSFGTSLLRWLKGWFVDLDVSGTTTTSSLTVANNITMTSPNGTAYNCGVADGGAFTCS